VVQISYENQMLSCYRSPK